jgi:hypothetical protein
MAYDEINGDPMRYKWGYKWEYSVFFWDITPQQGLSRNRVCPKIVVIIGHMMIILWSWGNCPVFRQTHTFFYI